MLSLVQRVGDIGISMSVEKGLALTELVSS